MDGLLTLLLFAGLFFVMMKFGCGAHMMHGRHDSHGHGKHDEGKQKHIDPVCGMEVNIEQGYGKMYEGNLYRFCSRDCLDKFEKEPRKYLLKDLSHDKHHHEGGEL